MSAAFRTGREKLAKQTKLEPKVVMSHRAVGMFFLLLIISRWEIEQPGKDPGERLLEHLLPHIIPASPLGWSQSREVVSTQLLAIHIRRSIFLILS